MNKRLVGLLLVALVAGLVLGTGSASAWLILLSGRQIKALDDPAATATVNRPSTDLRRPEKSGLTATSSPLCCETREPVSIAGARAGVAVGPWGRSRRADRGG